MDAGWKTRSLIFLAGGLCCVAQVWAQGSLVGYVKTTEPDANLIVGGKPIKAQSGMPLQTGFIIKTGDKGTLGVTLRDNTLLSVGPNSEFVVEEYLFAPGKGEFKLLATMTKGTLQYVSGLIAKLSPDAVTFKTPTSLIGVRGTHFLLLVEEEKP
jgi:hypothetical protein